MTRLALIADSHVANHKRWGGAVEGGLNQRGWECVRTLERCSLLAKDRGANALFVLGDLFDHTRPSPSLVAETARALVAGGIPVYVLLGNHDRQSMHDLDQACASMGLIEGITIVTVPMTVVTFHDTDVGLIPYKTGEAKDWVASGMAELAGAWSSSSTRRRVVLTHCGIWDDDTPPYLKAAKDAVGIGHVRWLCEAHKVHLFAAGNWHESRSWRPREGTEDPRVLIPGTVCPHNFSDPSSEHGKVVVWDSATDSWKSTAVPSPLFIKHLVRVPPAPGAPTIFNELRNHYAARYPERAYVRLTFKRADSGAAMEMRGSILDLHPDTVVHTEELEAESKATVRDAARAAVTAGLPGQSMDLFSELAAVEEPGTKDGVLRRLDAYRKLAG